MEHCRGIHLQQAQHQLREQAHHKGKQSGVNSHRIQQNRRARSSFVGWFGIHGQNKFEVIAHANNRIDYGGNNYSQEA